MNRPDRAAPASSATDAETIGHRMSWRSNVVPVLAFALLGLSLAQCSSAQPPEWPELGSLDEPYYLDVGRLQAKAGSEFMNPHEPVSFERYSEVLAVMFDDGELLPDVAMKHYPHLTLASESPWPSTGVEVVFVGDSREFYLREDHMMGHFDAFIGPFDGDPRLLLEGAAQRLNQN